MNDDVVSSLDLGAIELMYLETFLKSGVIISRADFMSNMIGFYQTIITVLIALVALVAGGTYIVIKDSTKLQIRDMTSEKLDEFFGGQDFETLMDKKVAQLEASVAERYEDLQAALERFEEYEARFGPLMAGADSSPDEPDDEAGADRLPAVRAEEVR